MTFEQFLTQHLETRLRQRRLLVVHDPEERFREIAQGLADKRTTVLDCGGDLLEARENGLDALAALGEDASCLKRLVLYVPHAKSLDDADRCADPFAAFVEAGASFPDGAGDDYRQLCLQFLPEQAGRIKELFADGAAPSLSVINSLRTGAAESPVLRDLLKAEGPKDMLVKFLAASEETVKQLKAASHWVKDLKDLVARTLAFKLDGAKEEVEALQIQLWRYLLFSEFAADLPVALPADLQSVPRAGLSQEPFVRSLCVALRDLVSAQNAYEAAANRVAEELGLEARCDAIEDFGVLDTFSFEERGFLRRFADQVLAERFDEAREIVVRRQTSFWVERDARRAAEWQAADLAARLLMELQQLAPELVATRSLDEWIDFYAGRFARIDALHRAMEQAAVEIEPAAAVLATVLDRARDTHQTACDQVARRFQTAAAGAGWPSTEKARAVDIFDRWVEPRWKSGERVVYFWIDALRYELAQTLEAALATQHTVKLERVCASLPSLTPVGMAALLPGAASALEIQTASGKIVAMMNGKPVTGPKDRLEVLAAHVGSSRVALANLEDLAAGKLPDQIDMIEVLAVKTNDIDSLGESNPAFFIGMLPGILRKIQQAVNQAAEAGFTRAVLATDHGFCWMKSTSAGNAVAKPPGQWQVAKERALLGEGSADSNSLLFKAAEAGIRMAAPHLGVPKGLACYQAGVTYFHGGLSPQECVLPVLDVVLKAPQKERNNQRAEISLTYRGRSSGTVTALIPTLELAYPAADLFGPATVRVLLQGIDKNGNVIAEAGSSTVVDPDSKEVHLERGKAIKVPLRIHEGFEGTFKAVALDPATGATLATIKLETAFHH